MAYDNRSVAVVPAMKLPEEAISYGVDHKQWRVLVEAIFPNAKTPEAILLALAYCKAKKYDPMKRAVHIVTVYNSSIKRMVETVWPGINSILTDAARTGKFAGMDSPVYGPDVSGVFYEADEHGNQKRQVSLEYPEWCRVTVYRMVSGVRCPFVGEVFWREAYAKSSRWSEIPNEMWAKRTRGQLAKCAQAAALRLAFPEAADYTHEEMEGRELPAGTRYVVDGEPSEPEPQQLEDATEAKAEPAPAQEAGVVHFTLNGKRVKIAESEVADKLVSKATSDPSTAAALVEQNWQWFAPDERKQLLDAMLQAMDRDTATALEGFILEQQEPIE